MKSLKSWNLPELLTVLLVILMLTTPALLAQTPVETTFTIGTNATYASTSYSAGLNNPANSAFKPLVLDVLLYATNATITLKRSTTGAAYYTCAMGTSTNAILYLTNGFYFLKGDSIVVGVGSTLIGGTVKVQGLEQ